MNVDRMRKYNRKGVQTQPPREPKPPVVVVIDAVGNRIEVP